MFTADPVSGNRTVTAIEAVAGLADGLVAGTCSRTATAFARASSPNARRRVQRPVLTDAQLVELADVGRLLARELGGPQDIEWCLAGDAISVVQSRPITTL